MSPKQQCIGGSRAGWISVSTCGTRHLRTIVRSPRRSRPASHPAHAPRPATPTGGTSVPLDTNPVYAKT